MSLYTLLQATETAIEMMDPLAQTALEESYFSLILKGGWILLPIFLLSLLSIYVIINKWFVIDKLGKKDSIWLSRVLELIHDNKIDKAVKICVERPHAAGQVIGSGLKDFDNTIEDVQESMEVEARQQLSELESQMNWLAVTASIAPMLGFLGTIFGVIKIFYDIARTNDLAIDTISTGLYQKMICSGAGLLVGIIAFAGYHLLNGRIDKIVVDLDRASNEALRAIKAVKKA